MVKPVKRKIGEHVEQSEKSNPGDIDETIKHAVVDIFRALKAAAGFERQKLVRRKKQAQHEGASQQLARFEAEEEALKGFDLYQLAEFQFYKTLLRIKSMSSTSVLPGYVWSKVETSKQHRDGAYLNVSARLFKSNYVTEVMEEAVKGIYQATGVPEGAKRTKRLRKADFQGILEPTVEKANTKSSQNTDLATNFGSSARDETSKIDSFRVNTETTSISPAPDLPDSDIDEDIETSVDSSTRAADSETGSASFSIPKEVQRAKTKVVRAERSLVPPTSTAFLPSLATGYFSGSDDEGSFIEDIEEAKPRKNRRGQRERQAIAQLKYGKQANHLKKQRQGRDHGWDSKKGAQLDSKANDRNTKKNDEQRDKVGRDKRDTRSTHSSHDTRNARNVEHRHKSDQEALHPSWEAARKMKEQKTLPAYQGKKTVFE